MRCPERALRGSTTISAALRLLPGLPAGVVLTFALAACTAGPMIDSLPAGVGLPAGAPERPATPYQYPAVHDTPPPRATPVMSEEEQVKVEKDLTVVRDRQEARTGTAKETAHKPKKKPADAEKAPDTGAKDGAKTNP
jgi:hypothetical protein